MTDKIKAVEFGNTNEFQAAIETLKRNLPYTKQYVAVVAEIRKASYDAHVAKGFTPAQALVLCTSSTT